MIQTVISVIFIIAGLFFLVSSCIGMLRLPGFYARLHASGNSETLGLALSLIGLAIYETETVITIKLILVFIVVFIGNPIGTHILGREAYKLGYPVIEDDEWKEKVREENR